MVVTDTPFEGTLYTVPLASYCPVGSVLTAPNVCTTIGSA